MNKPDPTIENDLNAIEAALSEGRVTATHPDDRQLQELALLLQADSPRPDPAFAADLADDVHTGFPREQRTLRSRLPQLPRIRLPLAAAGVAASLLLAVVVVNAVKDEDPEPTQSVLAESEDSGGGGTELSAPPRPGSVEVHKLQAGRPADAVASPTTLPYPPQPGGGNFVPGRNERRIERSASLTLAASGDELDRVADRIAVVTDRHGGFVLSSQVTAGDDGASGGTFDLRIPVGRLQPALRDLAALGDVRSRSMAGQDVTRQVVTAADRLQGARAERKSLLNRLENAATDTEAEALRRRLDLNAAELRGLRSQLRDLRLSTGYATVSVNLQSEDGDGSGGSGGSSSIDDALDDALDSLVASLGIALRILGVALPLGLLALAAWLTARTLRRRRREAALG
jgi:hypothetical protein